MGDADALPDYVLDPNAVLNDKDAAWRHGAPPDYSKTRAFYEESTQTPKVQLMDPYKRLTILSPAKQMTHAAGSLPDLVSNLVKNWEIEASFKTSLDDWRTIDHSKYTFSLNGGLPQTGDHMLRVGTYNALLTSSSYYDPEHNDFSTSHKAFKRMMPTFAWEVLEVYSGPPVVIFKWRHWGYMANDYVGYNKYASKFLDKGRWILIHVLVEEKRSPSKRMVV
jgi:hypothetical protein